MLVNAIKEMRRSRDLFGEDLEIVQTNHSPILYKDVFIRIGFILHVKSNYPNVNTKLSLTTFPRF